MEYKESIENALESILNVEECNIKAEDLSESERNIIVKFKMRYSKSVKGFVKVVPSKALTVLVQIKVRGSGNVYCMTMCEYDGRLVNFRKDWLESFKTKNINDFVERLVKYGVL